MKVLYVASEALPFIATGGLGDVAGALPQALRKRLVGCRVVLPLYDDIPAVYKENMKFVAGISVPVAWRRQYCGIYETKVDGVICYLIENPYYFKRKGLYGYNDDAERFAFFSRAVLEILPHISFKPDIIHCNDWQSALVPIYYSTIYAQKEGYENIKTVFTIHNIQYQGKYGFGLFADVFGLPESATSIVEYSGDVNLMKGAIEAANVVTTVSPTYAKEILDPWYSYGLESILNLRQHKIKGILNGIDTIGYNPETDAMIFENYSMLNHSGKAVNKSNLQKFMALELNEKRPVIGMVTRLVSNKGLDLVREIVEKLLAETDVQLAVLGSGDWQYEGFFQELSLKHRGRVAVKTGFIPDVARKIYAGSDMFLMPSKNEPCGLSQMVALRYGTLPIVRMTGGLKDTVSDCGDGKGNGFVFQSYDSGDMYDAIKRAIAAYQNKAEWDVLVERAMRCDNSWGSSANEYIKLYKSILK
ncbi:MAG: glycogen synthase GlgA [Clostridia bacterium]|nr:glycogen synthase GlgA [Clostridia bacterium]